MTPERWQQIDRVLQRVVDTGAAERIALLDELCTGDEELRQEVESLISAQEITQSFLEVPALEEAAYLLCEDEAGSNEGLVIGRYRIGVLLGAGGMGDVYLAEDTNLDIKVAIKFLPSYLEADELAKGRLIREAKAAAQLDHPNICAVYEVKEEADRSFIVMQYVDGQTLADMIHHKPLDIPEALEISIQIVAALAEAHAHGIVHRDIKPRNVMINTRRQVKVLDFGLVKLVSDGSAVEQDFSSSQITLSRPGQQAGTPPYMSPEQAGGVAVDVRCDLFAVGVILYECLCGRRPFEGDTPEAILAKVRHHHPPPPSQFNPGISQELDRVILQALAKNPDARYQSANDLLLDLRGVEAKLKGEHLKLTKPWWRKFDRRWVMTSTTSILHRPGIFIPAVGTAIVFALWLISPPPTIRSSSPQAMYWYEKGITALRDGTYQTASNALEQAIQTDDKFVLAHLRLAEAYAELDHGDKAKDEVIRAESLANELHLQRLDALYLQAISKTVLRDFTPAIESYRQIARLTPAKDKARVYFDLGRAYEKNDQIKDARENYFEATQLSPQDAAALLQLGVVCSHQQDFTCAIEAFQKAEAWYQAQSNLEGVTEVFFQRGFLFLGRNDLAAARTELEKGLELTKATKNQYQQIRILLALSNVTAIEGHARQAEQQALEAVDLARTNGVENLSVNGLIWLGNTFLAQADYNNGEKYYRHGLELAQRDKLRLNEAWARVQLGSLRLSQHKTDEGLIYVEQALGFFQQGGYRKWLSDALPLQGRALRDKGDLAGALKAFSAQLQVGEQIGDPGQVALAHEEIGRVLSDQEQYAEALRHFDISHQINSSLKAQLYVGFDAMYRASVLWQIGRYEETATALQEVSSIAETPGGTNNLLLAAIQIIKARVELSELRNQQAGLNSRRALNLADTQYKVTAIQARYVLGLAQSRSGAPRAGGRLCAAALEMAIQTGDQQLVSAALLAQAEVMMDGGNAQRALRTALDAQKGFAQFGQKDSEWRAWLIAARASQRLGKELETRGYASKSSAALASLEQAWGAEPYKGYLSRPDIQHFQKQLGLIPKLQP